MGSSVAAKLYSDTFKLLKEIQKALPGNPSLISLLDEAVKLLAQKYLKEGEDDAKP